MLFKNKNRKKKEILNQNISLKKNVNEASDNSITNINKKIKSPIMNNLKNENSNEHISKNSQNSFKLNSNNASNSIDENHINSQTNVKLKSSTSENRQTISNAEIEDDSTKLVNRIEEIFKKYKHIFDQDDSNDFQSIIETLRNNLNGAD